MTRRPFALALSALGWAGFTLVMLWAMLFLAGVVVRPTVDGPARLGAVASAAIDLGLLLLFALQHSVMARPGVKAVMRRRVPVQLERTVYVLATVACLALCLGLWQPFGGTVWRIDGPVTGVVWGVCALGWLLAIASTYAVDHFELTGLRQAGWGAPRGPADGDLHVRGLYGLVRHPLMTGLLIAFWATPRMGAAHLLFAAAGTAYILVGVRFEERDLRRSFGAAYEAYAARVPALIPRLRLRPRAASAVRVTDEPGRDLGA